MIAEFLSKEGRLLLPLVDMVEEARLAVDEVVGRATIEALLVLSAQCVAEPKHRGKASSGIRWHGPQGSGVRLSNRTVTVDRPRLRHKGEGRSGEVEIPAYDTVVLDMLADAGLLEGPVEIFTSNQIENPLSMVRWVSWRRGDGARSTLQDSERGGYVATTARERAEPTSDRVSDTPEKMMGCWP